MGRGVSTPRMVTAAQAHAAHLPAPLPSATGRGLGRLLPVSIAAEGGFLGSQGQVVETGWDPQIQRQSCAQPPAMSQARLLDDVYAQPMAVNTIIAPFHRWESQAQRSYTTYPRSHSQRGAELGLEPGQAPLKHCMSE